MKSKMKRNKENKAKIRIFNYCHLNKNEQRRLDMIMKVSDITYHMLYVVMCRDKYPVIELTKHQDIHGVPWELTDYNSQIKICINEIKDEYEGITKIKFPIIKKKWKPILQGTSTCSFILPHSSYVMRNQN